MNRLTPIALVALLPFPAFAQDDCSVSITEMSWASAQLVTEVTGFLIEHGYGCEVERVPSDTVTAMTSVAENGTPDIVTELWENADGEIYPRLKEEGKLVEAGEVLVPGGVEGWWIPTALAEAHPELTSIEGVLANPALVGGTFHNCPDGWGCRDVNDNLVRALDLESKGLEVFNHGSGETLAASMAAAVEADEPWFGYYWGPTAPLGKYDMTRVRLGAHDPDIFANLTLSNAEDPQVSDYAPSKVYTAITADFRDRQPELAELVGKIQFDTDIMSEMLAWQLENSASAEETAVNFLTTHSDIWGAWISDEARAELSALLQ